MNPEFGVLRRGLGINIDLNYKFNYPEERGRGVGGGGVLSLSLSRNTGVARILGQPWRVAAAAIGERRLKRANYLKHSLVSPLPKE